jgi:DNA-binding CsgD family transcriptional regulator
MGVDDGPEHLAIAKGWSRPRPLQYSVEMPRTRGFGFVGRSAERRSIDDALVRARDGRSAALVISGEPGIGKTALLRYAGRQAAGFRVLPVDGVQAEMDLPFSGLHRLCAPVMDSLGTLPDPQQNALRVALGTTSGDAPDRFLIAVAVLNLLATTAADRPLLCLVDDSQWLDTTSLEALGFVARRLVADAVAMIFVLREPSITRAFDGLTRLPVHGLDEPDAHALLARAVPGRLNQQIRDRIVGESRGNPLAMLELSQNMSWAERAGGFAIAAGDVPAQLIQEYQRRIAQLDEPTQQLMLLAAAEPLGDASLLWRAADHESIGAGALAPAAQAGLLDVDDHVRFTHPLVRAAVYQAASTDDRRRAHHALAEASDPEVAADSRAWHRALAAAGPDEDVASELEHCAGRAERRGGLAAAAAFLDRATALTPDSEVQVTRALAAAETAFQAGDLEVTQRLLATAQSGALNEFQRARAALLRGHMALVTRYGNEAGALLLEAAKHLEPFDLSLARRAYLTAWSGAVTAQHLGGADVMAQVSRSVRALPPLPPHPHPLDVVIDAFAMLIVEGHEAAAPLLRRAAREVLTLPVDDVLRWGLQVGGVRSAIWDDDAIAVYQRQVQLVRNAGALAELPIHLQSLALEEAWRGDLGGARRLMAEATSISVATRIPVPPFATLRILALQGREAEATALIDSVIRDGTMHGQGIAVMVAHWAAAVLNNGLGRYERAAAAAGEIVTNGILPWLTMWARCELIEASVRLGDRNLAEATLDGLLSTTRPARSRLGRGVEARCQALVADDGDAERWHVEAIKQLSQTHNRTELARAQLAFGEWLHRQSRVPEARARLRDAEQMFVDIGMEAFAGRAGRELITAGAKPSTRLVQQRGELTAQEGQIAQLARDGLTNAQIGARLFLSPRTVEWHLHNAFRKLRIDSRDALNDILAADTQSRSALTG